MSLVIDVTHFVTPDGADSVVSFTLLCLWLHCDVIVSELKNIKNE